MNLLYKRELLNHTSKSMPCEPEHQVCSNHRLLGTNYDEELLPGRLRFRDFQDLLKSKK